MRQATQVSAAGYRNHDGNSRFGTCFWLQPEKAPRGQNATPIRMPRRQTTRLFFLTLP